MDRIIYPQDDGPIAIITPIEVPTEEGEAERDALIRFARTHVPAGAPFLVVAPEDIPTDRTWRDAWIADFSNPDGIGGVS